MIALISLIIVILLVLSSLLISMEQLLPYLKLTINRKLYIKDPESSPLGKEIIRQSIDLINEVGFEKFTFKKLGQKIDSNESSVYRYFENKHKLLLYLSSLYWGILEYRLVFETNNIDDPVKKLEAAVDVVVGTPQHIDTGSQINLLALRSIIIAEFTKSYHNKSVDLENKEGFFEEYKRLINRVVKMVLDLNSNYPFPKSWASNLIDGGLHQHFLVEHFPSITDCSKKQPPNHFFKNQIKGLIKA
jgi:AcrR family transcriptional regulator